MCRLSVVVPVYNEEENVGELVREIESALEGYPAAYEVLVVDDGSRDGTLRRLLELRRGRHRLRIVKLRSNCGQTAAMKAGIDLARGEVIVTMDGDLQNDPRDIAGLVEKLEEGYELVAGWRKDRKDRFFSRKLPSSAANWLIRRVTGVPIHDNGCSLKAYRAKVIQETPLYSELHRFIPAMTTVPGARIAEVPVNHRPRIRGRSKYGLSRIGKVFFDIVTVKMLIAFARRPLHLFGLLSLPVLAFAAAAMAVFLYDAVAEKGSDGPVFGSVAILLAVLAMDCLMVGLVAELVVKTGRRNEYYAGSRIRPW